VHVNVRFIVIIIILIIIAVVVVSSGFMEVNRNTMKFACAIDSRLSIFRLALNLLVNTFSIGIINLHMYTYK
jgi:hypothetical protein